MNEEKYPIGTKVYFNSDIDDTGEVVIRQGTILSISDHDINIMGKIRTKKMYKISEGLFMQRNSFYTLEELMLMANRLQYLTKEIDKTKAIEKEV